MTFVQVAIVMISCGFLTSTRMIIVVDLEDANAESYQRV